MPEYREFVRLFNKAYAKLLSIAPDLESIDELEDEEQELEFVEAFRELMRLKNILVSFVDFSFDDLSMTEQAFEDYKSKYLDLYDKVRTAKNTEKESVLEEVDFELELIQRDEINVAYILRLLAKLKEADTDKEYEYQYKAIMQLIGGTPELRSKQELIERFIKEHMADLDTSEEVLEAFDSYWEGEKEKATQQICEEEGLIPDNIKRLVGRMIYSSQEPSREDVFDTMKEKPSLFKRDDAYTRITQRMKKLVDVFYRDI